MHRLDKEKTHPLRKRLLRIANLTEDSPVGEERNQHMVIRSALVAIHRRKAFQYGDYVKARRKSGYGRLLSVATLFIDMKRKWERLETLMMRLVEKRHWADADYDALYEVLQDLSIYATMNIDLLAETEGTGGIPRESDSDADPDPALPPFPGIMKSHD